MQANTDWVMDLPSAGAGSVTVALVMCYDHHTVISPEGTGHVI